MTRKVEVVKDESRLVRISGAVHAILRKFAFFKERQMMQVVDEAVTEYINKRERKHE